MEIKEKKYLVIGGLVKSRSDGDIHHVSAPRLCALYGVNMDECVLADERDNDIEWVEVRNGHLTRLRPRYDGNYTLPKAAQAAQ